METNNSDKNKIQLTDEKNENGDNCSQKTDNLN